MLNNLTGILKDELDTPVLLIDMDIMESNIAKMARYFRTVNADLRPHTKTHKTPILAHKQIEAGAVGITCAKLGEAEVMAAAGIKNILIANQIVTGQKISRLVNLARYAHIMVAVDHEENIENLSRAAQQKGVKLQVLVEVNTGMNRCGVSAGESALKLAQKLDKAKNLDFTGLQGYEGHAVAIPDFDERKSAAEKALSLLAETKEILEKNGLQVNTVSGGGTGTYNISGQHPVMTEIQAGSYIFMDSYYRKVLKDFDCALTILTTVISRPNRDMVILDAGMKTVTKEFGLPEVKDIKGAELTGLSEEHGKLDLSKSNLELKPGDKIEIIPSHGCTTINLHDDYYAIRDGKLEAVWNIAARGKIR
ncbi:DSD1 family PLP-dependent enzyme [Candidatus Poribacteria bacterium]|nr:DSD1 family PLP-dependent enzyme [Candidatus Poribacteria bacterium]